MSVVLVLSDVVLTLPSTCIIRCCGDIAQHAAIINVCKAAEKLVLTSTSLFVGKVTEQNLGKDFETLLGMLRPEESFNKKDIKLLKEQIFGPNVFWVTGTRTTDDILDGGIVVSQKPTIACELASQVGCAVCSTVILGT